MGSVLARGAPGCGAVCTPQPRKCSRRSANVFSFGADVFSSGADVSSFWRNVSSFRADVSSFGVEVSSLGVEVFTRPDDALAWDDAERAGNGV